MAKLSGALAGGYRSFARRWLLPMCLLVCVLPQSRAVDAQTVVRQEATERQVKAAYLSKFGSYVKWPDQAFATPDSPLKIGVIGADLLADDLEQLVAGHTVNGRPVTVRKLRHGDPLAGFNVLFIGRSESDRLADILAATKGLPMLTVTESEDALTLGSTINFVVVDGRVRFEVAPKTASLGNLNISARLLAAAYKVAPGAS
jgi:hypothetical protein